MPSLPSPRPKTSCNTTESISMLLKGALHICKTIIHFELLQKLWTRSKNFQTGYLRPRKQQENNELIHRSIEVALTELGELAWRLFCDKETSAPKGATRWSTEDVDELVIRASFTLQRRPNEGLGFLSRAVCFTERQYGSKLLAKAFRLAFTNCVLGLTVRLQDVARVRTKGHRCQETDLKSNG